MRHELDTVPIHLKLMLSIEEAALLLGLGRTTVYALIGTGQLKTKPVGGRRMITRRELERFCGTNAAAVLPERSAR